jgi:DNA-binding MarR family transcriptional regulator/N-acetylglutamate synthase-like GNAT family acetyltransferase
LLHKGLLNTPFTLSEARVLYELGQQAATTATQLSQALGLDPAQMSRILQSLSRRALVHRQRSSTDRRQTWLSLTTAGGVAFATLNTRSHEEIGAMLGPLAGTEQDRLANAMRTIEAILQPAASQPRYLLRPHQPGDMGWVVYRHGLLYAQEYGWDESFEALVARIVADFIDHFDAKRERCWIAEQDGETIGSVFLVKQSETVAKLRLLLVEPRARGLGIGGRLVTECIRFARQTGYEKMMLWTNSVLEPARRIYQRAGFVLVHSEPHHSFGQDLVGETWELAL